MMHGATLLIIFQTGLGVLSGPGAEEDAERARALKFLVSDSSKGSLNGRRMVSLAVVGLSRKQWSSRALLS